ncbi:MAG: hypothetical protein J6Z38_03270 [Lachnospiraceae bacterium]|nr:hypothetical protein [Lachnospiraceae bacterium]
MIYREKVVTRIDDFDGSGKMRPTAVLKLLENTASHHIALVAGDVLESSMQGITWMMTEWRVEILRTPDHRDKLQAETWATGNPPEIRNRREIRLLTEDGEVLVNAEMVSALFDLKAQRVIRIDEEVLAPYQPEDRYLFETEPPRFQMPEHCTLEKQLTVRRSDVDFNGHAHNTVFLDYALEPLPLDAFAKRPVKAFRVALRRQLRYGQTLTARGARTEDGYTVGLVNEEGVLCGGADIRL